MFRSFLALMLTAAALSQPFAAHAGSYQFRVLAKGLAAPASFEVLNAPGLAQVFNAGTVGSYAAPDIQIFFSNKGGQAGSLAIPSFQGANPADFSAVSTCDKIPAGNSCSVVVRFKPIAIGVRTASLTLNGARYTFSGVGNASFGGTWAATPSTTFGIQENLTTSTKRFQLVKTGGTGTMSVGFTMTGDVSQFKFTSVGTSLSGGWTCASGGIISADKTSTTYCHARDTSGALANIEVDVQYAPTVIGDHSITVTPSTNNGTALPAPLTVTGSSRFDPAGAWATGTSGAFGTVQKLTTSTKRFQLVKTGGTGTMSVGFTMTGDVSQFKFTSVGTSLSGGWTCASGGIISADKTSTTYCYARGTGGALANIEVDVQYAPTVTGSHSVTVTPMTNNGTLIPGPITLSGTAP